MSDKHVFFYTQGWQVCSISLVTKEKKTIRIKRCDNWPILTERERSNEILPPPCLSCLFHCSQCEGAVERERMREREKERDRQIDRQIDR